MFTLTKLLQAKAAECHAENYRRMVKYTYPITLGEYSTNADFKNEEGELEKINAFYTERKNAELKQIKSWPAFVGFGLGVAAAVGSFFAGFWLLIVTAGCAIYGAGTLLSNRSKKKHIEQRCRESIKATGAQMKKLFGEFREYRAEFEEYDAYYDRIENELNKI